jgi:hypothetical protein
MTYNNKYFFEFATLKTADKSQLYYKVLFAQKEDIPVVYDLVELKASNSPFILSYKSAEDFAFSPFRVSSAEINILYPYGASNDVPQPENFFTALDDLSWRVQLLESTDNGISFQLKWQGFLITSDVEYEWQDAYYYRLTATDNLGVLKDIKYSREDRFAMREYIPTQGAEIIDFIAELLEPTGQNLNITIACNWKNNNVTQTFEDILISKFSAINWETGEPKDCHTILSRLVGSLGCILYQSNIDATWTILNINEIGTTLNNQIPTIVYNSIGTQINTGTLSLNDTINLGDEFIWRDTNQIVTLKRPIGYIKMMFPYERKNLLRNYGFQDDTQDIVDDWATVGTFPTTTIQLTPFFKSILDTPYDDVITRIEATGTIVDSSNYLRNFVGLIETDLNTIENPSANGVFFFFYIKFKYRATKSFPEPEDGFNYQLVIDSGASVANYYFDNTNPLYTNTNNGGSFTTGINGRIAEFVTEYNKNIVCQTRTTAVSVSDITSVELRFLNFINGTGITAGQYLIDDVELNISAVRWNQLTELGFYASIGGFKNNPMEIKTNFHGGTDTLDWWFFEDCIGVKFTPNVVTRPQSNLLWTRQWETYSESLNENLIQKVCRNIISFYRKSSRKFTGNVYGDGMTFPKYFAIKGAVDKTAKQQLEEAFEAYVLEDGGTIENTYCNSDFLEEFFVQDSKFLTIEETIDYANSTTNVNLHEDLTSTTETNFQTGATHKYNSNGVFGQTTGSNINSQQVTIGIGG